MKKTSHGQSTSAMDTRKVSCRKLQCVYCSKKTLIIVFIATICTWTLYGQFGLPMIFPQQTQQQLVTPDQFDTFMENLPEGKRQQIINFYFPSLIVAIQTQNIRDVKFLVDLAPIVRKYDAMFEAHLAAAQLAASNATPMAPKCGNIVNGGFGGGLADGGTRSQRRCSLCNGRGRRHGFRTPVYAGCSSKRWCSECNAMVGASHSHDSEICPSCGGRGTY